MPMSLVDPVQRVLHAREVGLRGIGEELVGAYSGALESTTKRRLIDAEIRVCDGHVDEAGPLLPGIFPDSVDGIVIVIGEQKPASGSKRVRLPHKLQCR